MMFYLASPITISSAYPFIRYSILGFRTPILNRVFPMRSSSFIFLPFFGSIPAFFKFYLISYSNSDCFILYSSGFCWLSFNNSCLFFANFANSSTIAVYLCPTSFVRFAPRALITVLGLGRC